MPRTLRTRRKDSKRRRPSQADPTYEPSGGQLSSGQEEGCSAAKRRNTRSASKAEPGHHSQLSQLADTDPEFYQFLKEEDRGLLEFSEEEHEEEGEEGEEEEEEEGMGKPEPVPLHITSRSEQLVQGEDEEEEEGKERERDVKRKGAGDEKGQEMSAELVTLQVVQRWVRELTEEHSLKALRQVTKALRVGLASLLKDFDNASAPYRVEGTAEFNALLVACLKHIPTCISHYIPSCPQLPSSHKSWKQVRSPVRQYLLALPELLKAMKDPSLCCSVLKQMQSLAPYIVCFGKMHGTYRSILISMWESGDSRVQVMAFLLLRRIVLLRPKPALQKLIRTMYMASTRSSKFVTPSALPRLRFMQNCLLEVLAMHPPTTYQNGFVYIRQLAQHLRTAMTSGKQQDKDMVYNWQYIQSLQLWMQVLATVSHECLRPLVYPLVQIALGTLELQPSSYFQPLRLHLVESLLQLVAATDVFIPLFPYLLDIMEAQAKSVKKEAGKPPSLACMLRVSKGQIQSRGYQSAVLNKCFELILRLFSTHSHCVGFPELAHPTAAHLKKIMKNTPLSWLRLQLKVLLEKVEEVSAEITRDRVSVSFSPKDSDQIQAWERERKEKGNALKKFLTTWQKSHNPVEEGDREEEEGEGEEEGEDSNSVEDMAISDF